MSDFEKELQEMVQQEVDKPEEALPSIEEQKAIVAELKRLEEAGELTPEVLEAHFGKFSADDSAPIH
ncbi:chromosome partitioning protein ParA [Aliivibrio fischeri]|uniref:chromosome partitioning protein ParA n=1 Tax=Aliivibrio fischeri TaxID=668 RepID=UPI00080DD8C1|nr:chromosome partitioning protein ParA [Aliivibrio fischeri]OCH40672.1 chromosome partitioning protein ParA [Aliivibrio fischeri]OED53408.1 chromosome partitioning protein ParA [Aliivibrio fischeri]